MLNYKKITDQLHINKLETIMYGSDFYGPVSYEEVENDCSRDEAYVVVLMQDYYKDGDYIYYYATKEGSKAHYRAGYMIVRVDADSYKIVKDIETMRQ